MSVVNHSSFENNIQVLDSAEIDSVDGGVLPVLAIAYIGIGINVGTLLVGAGVLVGLEMSRD